MLPANPTRVIREPSVFKSKLSRENEFFQLFMDSSNLITEGAMVFQKMIKDLANSETYSQQIKDIEHKADDVTHRTIALLHKTFITPLDRDDIHTLITRMDDILDFIDAAAQRIYFYGIKQGTNDLQLLADTCVAAAVLIKEAISGLRNLKNPKGLFATCIEINRLENEADNILRRGVASLFKDEPDIRRLIMLKEIYELLETVTDRCEDVANCIEGIVLEYA